MKNQLRVEVEPLSEQRWTKIERSLMARLEDEALTAQDSKGRHGKQLGLRTWLAAAALVGALFVVVAIRWMPEPVASDHPSRITTGPSPSHLALPGLTLDVEPQSAVVLSAETPQGVLLVLDRGTIVCQVAPRSSDSPLIVQAGTARVKVVGTRFSVSRTGENARVKVYRGVVEVTSFGQTLRVRAGEEWPAQGQRARHADTRPPPDATAGAQAPASSTGRPSHSEDVDGETAPSPPRSSTSSSQKPPKTADDTTSSATETGPSSRPSNRGEPETAPHSSSQAVFERATVLERSDPGRASQLYRSLESGTDSWARNALYAHGRLEASRGNADEARRLLERYLERFPRGSNAADARAVLERLE
jgi:hypothetical protein